MVGFPNAELTQPVLTSHAGNPAGGHRGFYFPSCARCAVCGDALAARHRVTTWRRRMNVAYAISGLLALALFAYLIYALVKPEKF